MEDLKINCPKCGGHIAFPPDVAGRSAACPHCQAPILLGTKPRTVLWMMLGIGVVCAVVGAGMLFWRLAGRGRMTSRAEAQISSSSRGAASAMTSSWTNTLGMVFVPAPGTQARFSIWDTRVQDYRAFADANNEVDNGWQNPGFAQEDTHPVVNVSWNDAKAFCAWLTRKEQAEGKIGAGLSYRLPKDMEWTVVVGLHEATAGTPGAKDQKVKGVYPWGSQWPPPEGVGNYAPSLAVDSYPNTSPVGSFPPNQVGLYDLGGNVRQWCEDWYDNRRGARVFRGASWNDYLSKELLSSCRGARPPEGRFNDRGFRCVLSGVNP